MVTEMVMRSMAEAVLAISKAQAKVLVVWGVALLLSREGKESSKLFWILFYCLQCVELRA